MVSGIIYLDGGTGHELKQRGVTCSVPGTEDRFLSGLLANLERPADIQRLHADYIEAGADVITANSFVATKWSLEQVGMADRLPELVGAAIGNALAAVEGAGAARASSARVAVPLPPLKECYSSSEQYPEAESLEEYRQLASLAAARLGTSGGLLLCETMASEAEARLAATAAASQGLEYWVAYTLRDDTSARLRSGAPLSAAARSLAVEWRSIGIGRPPAAVLVNCCAPHAAGAAVPRLVKEMGGSGVRVGAYANGFRTSTDEFLGIAPPSQTPSDPSDFDAHGIITPAAYARHAVEWVRGGAGIVGGCCGTGPAHIRALRQAVESLPNGP